MIKCLNCGKDTANGMLCNECMTNADIEKLCIELHSFNPDVPFRLQVSVIMLFLNATALQPLAFRIPLQA